MRLLILSVSIFAACSPPPSAQDAPQHHGMLDAVLAALSAGQAPAHPPADQVTAPVGVRVQRTGTARAHHDVLYAPVSVGPDHGLVFAQLDAEGIPLRLAVLSANGGSASSAVTSYQDAWNERRSWNRATLLEKGFAQDGHYTDPGTDAWSRQQLAGAIAAFHRSPVGATRIEPEAPQASMDRWVWFRWRLELPGHAVLQHGFDVIHLKDEGTPDLVGGFFEAGP